MNGFTVVEYDSIPVVENLDGYDGKPALTAAEVDELEDMGSSHGIGQLLRHVSRSEVQFRQYVGLVRLGGRDIEVLPKIESLSGSPDSPDNQASIRWNLLRMLLVAYDLKVHLPSEAMSQTLETTWLDVFMQVFCRELMEQVRGGLTKRYRLEEDNLGVVRGRILLHEQLTHNFIHQERIACEYDELDEDHALNQMFKLVLLRMHSLARSNVVQNTVRELLVSFDAVTLRGFGGRWWEAITSDRMNARFEPSMALAKLFLNGMSPDVARGGERSYSLLFDMNYLFEQYVGRVLQELLRGRGLQTYLQEAKHYLMTLEGEIKSIFRLEPDIVVRRGKDLLCIGDTKWKRLKPEERKMGISQADLYQMLAYSERYGCNRVLMLYPFERKAGSSWSNGHLLTSMAARGTTVLIGQVCLSDLDDVPRQLQQLFERAVPTSSASDDVKLNPSYLTNDSHPSARVNEEPVLRS